jgi:hypothetical protein
MAILFCDSFDHYTTLSHKYASVSGSPSIGAFGRFSTSGLRSSNQNVYPVVPLTGNPATTIVHFAINTDSMGAGRCIAHWVDGGSPQLTVVLNTDGSVTVRRGDTSGTILGTSSAGLVPMDASYPHLGMALTVHNSTGTFELWVNGVSVYSLSGQDTQNSANAQATAFQLGISGSSSAQVDFDDLVILNNSGGSLDAFLGDVRVSALLPDGAGDSTQWTPSASTNVSNVDDTAPDGDTTYNASATAGQKDLFTMGALPAATGTVKAVVARLYHRKDDASARVIKAKVKHSSTEGDGGNISPGTGYGYSQDVFATNPSTTAAWTPSEVNAMQAGYEVVS